ncbi:MAG: hypothetical protein IJ374_05705 [Lachnospiraceae bacterium]|nr:hypothetical protein [Lachnospiraceae bacterium]
MKRYGKELFIILLQFLVFYILPMFAGPTDAMGLVVLILIATFVLSIILGSFSDQKVKFAYPVIAAILFVPSVYIYYNETALVHAMWYLVDSAIGLVIGTVIRVVAGRISR